MKHAKIFCKSLLKNFVLFDHLLGFLKLHLKTLKFCVFPVLQLYVEIFE